MSFNLGNFVGEWAENTSEVPQMLRGWADDLERGTTKDFQTFQDQFSGSGGAIRDNFTESRFAGYGAKAGAWLSKPVNMLIAGGALVGIIWGILSVSRKT